MSNIASTAPGVLQPTVIPYPAGANSARTAGIAIQTENNRQQTSLINTAHGGKRGRKGGASQIAVPTMQVLYPEPGAGNQTVNGNITATTTLGASSTANSVYDACIGQGPSCTSQVASTSGGSRSRSRSRSRYIYKFETKSKKGGVKWGCYSGGKRIKSKYKKSKQKRSKQKRSKRRFTKRR